LLVTSDNFGQLFLGWEGVGVSSYLLINFWFTRIAANQSAIKAIIVNRFGDIGILLCILTIIYLVKSLDFNIIFNLLKNLDNIYITFYIFEIHALSLISFSIFIGAVGKSAQMGLHTWLPDAMEGPTPVSALIHAATMVTAGVFVLIRLSPILEYSPKILVIITVIGALTGFFAGTIGIFQNDLKRVIAYSTCSQLGYMVVSCGLSSYSIALFHLMNHAFFKALLFLSAGAVIHAVIDEQDMRKMGGLLHILPYTFSMFIIGSLSLMGFPYTTGYYSKDIILELAYSKYTFYSIFVYWLLLLGAICTAFYSFRLLYITFLSETNISRNIFKYVHDVPQRMGIPLFILSFGSIFVGYIFKDMFIGIGSIFLNDSIGYNTQINYNALIEAEFLFVGIKLLPIIFSILSGIIALILYNYYPEYTYFIGNNYLINIYKFFNKKWYFDLIYNRIIVKFILDFGYFITFKMLDRGLIEFIGPTGIIRIIKNNENYHKSYISGYIFKYVFLMVMSTIFLLGIIKYYIYLEQITFLIYIYLSFNMIKYIYLYNK
jgi:NADH-ubiquinone oxidoreductase chain 5